jgi:hypothetical protein
MAEPKEKKKTDIKLETLCAADAWYWSYWGKIQLQSGEFRLEGHDYQVDPLQCDVKKQVIKKGAQMGFTDISILKTLHGQIYGRYPQGALYLFPTKDDVSDFSKARFSPLIANNPAVIGRFVRDTDAVHVKKINGSMLYLRGARPTAKIEGMKKSSSHLKSIPVDRIVFDERDEMNEEMIALALERLGHSEVKEAIHISTPSIPDYGIDREYNESDQRAWFIKCRKCGHETCLELEFPECMGERKDGTVFRKCKKCGEEVYPGDGRWVAQFPQRGAAGWWISQLNSIYIDPGEILHLFENPPNGNIAEVYNSKLGMAYIAAENRLTTADVYACCGNDAMAMRESGPCAMGVDVGKDLHVVIGKRKGDRAHKIVYVGRTESFKDLHELAKRFHVKSAVIDLYPETRKVREFQSAEPYKVFGCAYQDQLKEGERRDEKSGIVTVDRTELCDISHSLIADSLVELPRRSGEIEEYAKELVNMAKVLEENQETGSKVYRYRKLGPDHFRHATNYYYLASKERGLTSLSRPKEDYKKDEENQEYDILRH